MGKIGFVYMITSPSGRLYIGSTSEKSCEDRWRRYRQLTCKNQVKLLNSLKKYGPENHIFEELCKCDITDMLKYEVMIGTYYEVLDKDKGLNLKLPKYGDIYVCMSEETKEKIRASNKIAKKPPVSEATKLKMRGKRRPLGFKRKSRPPGLKYNMIKKREPGLKRNRIKREK